MMVLRMRLPPYNNNQGGDNLATQVCYKQTGSFPFFKLPRELRDNIYGRWSRTGIPRKGLRRYNATLQHCPVQELLLVNKQFSQEYGEELGRTNQPSHASMSRSNFEVYRKGHGSLPKCLNSIRHLVVRLSGRYMSSLLDGDTILDFRKLVKAMPKVEDILISFVVSASDWIRAYIAGTTANATRIPQLLFTPQSAGSCKVTMGPVIIHERLFQFRAVIDERRDKHFGHYMHDMAAKFSTGHTVSTRDIRNSVLYHPANRAEFEGTLSKGPYTWFGLDLTAVNLGPGSYEEVLTAIFSTP